eukprot:14091613-Alexandrium_andersonii.AAC.1
MDVEVSSEPPMKRQKGSGVSASKQLAYINKLSGSSAYRRAEGLLGRFAGQEDPGVYVPWDRVELAVEGQGTPGLDAYLARDSHNRELTQAEREEWNVCVTSET